MIVPYMKMSFVHARVSRVFSCHDHALLDLPGELAGAARVQEHPRQPRRAWCRRHLSWRPVDCNCAPHTPRHGRSCAEQPAVNAGNAGRRQTAHMSAAACWLRRQPQEAQGLRCRLFSRNERRPA